MAKRNWWGVGAGVAAAGAGLALFSQVAGRRAERQAPADGQFLDVDGARLHYVEIGPEETGAPPIVLIHGLGGQLRNFTYALTQRLPGRRLIVVDRPRSGYSTVPAGVEPGLAAQAALVARAIAALGLERPLVVGHSLGGAVALALALDHPDAVGALALIAPLTQAQDEVPSVFRGLVAGGESKLGRAIVANLLAVPLGAATGKQTEAAVFAPETAPADFAVHGGGVLALRPGNVYAAMYDIRAAHDEIAALVARYATLTLPVSILYGRGDNLLDYRLHGETTAAAIPGARLQLVDGGHMLPVTQPDLTAAFIRAASTPAA